MLGTSERSHFTQNLMLLYSGPLSEKSVFKRFPRGPVFWKTILENSNVSENGWTRFSIC